MPKEMTFDRLQLRALRTILTDEAIRAAAAVERAKTAKRPSQHEIEKRETYLATVKGMLDEARKPVMVERTNYMTGGKFMEDEDTPYYCSPSSETYWSS